MSVQFFFSIIKRSINLSFICLILHLETLAVHLFHIFESCWLNHCYSADHCRPTLYTACVWGLVNCQTQRVEFKNKYDKPHTISVINSLADILGLAHSQNTIPSLLRTDSVAYAAQLLLCECRPIYRKRERGGEGGGGWGKISDWSVCYLGH